MGCEEVFDKATEALPRLFQILGHLIDDFLIPVTKLGCTFRSMEAILPAKCGIAG